MKKVLVLDFGGQYNLLVARRVRECGVYCEIKPYTMSMDDIRAFGPAAIIFTGGPATVFEPNAPALDNAIFELGLPILGICYGQQLMIHQLGGACRRAEVREYGKVELTHDGTSLLFDGIEPTSICWMSHGVEVERLSPGFRAIAHTAGCAYAAIENAEKKLYGVQFHPEVLHTVHGTEILKNFLYKVCGLAPEWSMANYVSEAIEEVSAKVGGGKVLLDGRDLFAMKERERTIFRRRNIGFVFQAFNLIPELTVEQNILFPVLLDYQKPDTAYLEELLDVLDLRKRRSHLPGQLSGGQQQRVAIGRALITRPALILADEPTGNLDTRNSGEVIALLKEASRKYAQTIVMITHSRSIAQTADRVLQVSDGVLTDFGRCAE